MFWSVIELRTLIFIGLSYSTFKNSFSRLLIFFIIQSYSAFILLVFFCLNIAFGFTLSILLKLSIFPFYFWYLRVIPFFRNFIFLFSRTLFKIPSIYIMYNFSYILNYNFLFLSVLLTIFIGSLTIINRTDMRFILVSSSVVTNSWFVASQLVSLLLFFVYFVVYSFMFIAVIIFIRSNCSISFLSSFSIESKLIIFFCFITMAGLPPFPLFYVKVLVIYNFFIITNSFLLIMFIIFFRVLTLLGYLKYVFNITIFMYTNIVSYKLSI